MTRLLVIDDDWSFCTTVQHFLTDNDSLQVDVATTGGDGLVLVDRHIYQVVLLDLNLPDADGLELLPRLLSRQPDLGVIIVSANASIEKAVLAVKRGAYDLLTKPVDNMELLRLAINKVLQHQKLLERLTRAEQQLQEKHFSVVGHGPAMQRIFNLVRDVARSDATVLVQGESGTGKELIARSIHLQSNRKDREWIAFNCSALAESLSDSELFGHVKGSFTHAIADKKGLFEAAHLGTVFLDEVGDLPLSIQAKLLRVLQEGEVKRVGATETRQVDVRVIAATNAKLTQRVKEGRFREDLFYRLNVITVDIPPLRERPEEILPLAEHFMVKFATQAGKSLVGFTPAAQQLLLAHPWPGNVRELEHAIERAVLLERQDRIDRDSLPTVLDKPINGASEDFANPLAIDPTLNYQDAKQRTLTQFNLYYFHKLLEATAGNISKAAATAGMERSNFKKLLVQLGIDVTNFRNDRD